MTTTVTDVQEPDYRKYQQRLELTPEEAQAWQTCMKNTSVIMPTLVSAAIGYGIFRVTPFRAQAKYAALIGGAIGLISGRVALSQLCLGKVASMPNSTLRDRLMEAGYYGNNRSMSERQHQRFPPMDVQSEIHSSEEPSTAIVFDDYPAMTAYDTYSSLNDSSDLNTDDTDLTEPINMQKNVSYDELRHKNREEFYNKNKQWYGSRAPPEKSPAEATKQAPTTSKVPSAHEKNKYGDVWG